HSDTVKFVLWTARDEELVSGSNDRTKRPRNAEAGKLAGESLHAHSRAIYGLTLSNNDKILASASGDSTVRLWNIAT
ncbi:hypothetical protein BS17DRAFT_656033, partial [Gyrodon lividus]